MKNQVKELKMEKAHYEYYPNLLEIKINQM